MLRKISGSGFALAMIVIIALKHTALGFCLCQQQLVLNDCTCHVEAPAEPSDCGCCPEETSEAAPEPCRDCVVPIALDPGHFLWSTDSFTPADARSTPVILPTGLQDHPLPSAIALADSGSIRGSPPPGGPSLLLRTRVLRL